LGTEYDEKVVVGKVDVDANQEFAAKYGVRNIPTVLIFITSSREARSSLYKLTLIV
jgi:thioredoxin-like negative regulator of GroEL